MNRFGEHSVRQGAAPEPQHEARPATFFKGRRLSPALFGTIVLLFFFPLMFVECTGVTFTGVEAATGIGFPNPDHPGEVNTAQEHMVPDPLASVAFSAAVAGLALGLVRRRWAARLSVALGIIGCLSLTAFVTLVFAQAHQEAEVRPGVLAIPMFIVAAVANGVRSASIGATSEAGARRDTAHESQHRTVRSPRSVLRDRMHHHPVTRSTRE